MCCHKDPLTVVQNLQVAPCKAELPVKVRTKVAAEVWEICVLVERYKCTEAWFFDDLEIGKL